MPLTSLFPLTQLLNVHSSKFVNLKPSFLATKTGWDRATKLAVSFMDLWLKNLRKCSFRKYRDLVPFRQLIYSSYWLRRETDHFLSIILAEVSKENFHLQEYVFPLLPSPYPVPNIACNFYDNRYTWSNPVIGK